MLALPQKSRGIPMILQYFFVSASWLIAGLIIGYRLCLYLHTRKRVNTRIAKANKRWEQQRAKLPTCCMCPSIADYGYCQLGNDEKTRQWWCKVHFLGTHQPIPGKPNGWTCEHRLGQVLAEEQYTCGWCGKQQKYAEGLMLPATVNKMDKHAIYAFACNVCLSKLEAEEKKRKQEQAASAG
jgi:hypothetical protein